MTDPKADLSDSGEEFEQFDELDKNFHKIIEELVQDKSMDEFREEYSKLHDLLIKSHNSNVALIEKCRNLNNDILSNANKVSSIMSISQDDQRTIAGLHHEFENAWKLVEVSQEREAKSREVVEGLKQEVSHLSHLVEQGSSKAFQENNSLDEIQASIVYVKKEIEMQGTQINQISSQIQTAKGEVEEMNSYVKNLKDEFDTLTKDIDEYRSTNVQLASNCQQIHEDIDTARTEIKVAQDEVANNEGKIKHEHEVLEEKEIVSREYVRSLKSSIEDRDANLYNVHTKEILRDDKLKHRQKIVDDMAKYEDKIGIKGNEEVAFKKDLANIEEEIKESQKLLNEVKQQKQRLENEKQKIRERLHQVRDELFKITAQYSSVESDIILSRRIYERKLNENVILKMHKTNEVAATKQVLAQQDLVSNEILTTKIGNHNDRETIDIISKEIDMYEARTSSHRSNELQLKEEKKVYIEALDEKALELTKVVEQSKKKASLCDAIQNERDLGSRKLEKAIRENQVLIGENETLIESIKTLKEDIREKDRLCLLSHYNQRLIESQLSSLRHDIENMKEIIHQVESKNTEYRNRIQRSIYLLSQAELDIKKQKLVVSDLSFGHFSLDHIITQNSSEFEVLKDKVHLIKASIKTMSLAYNKKIKEVAQLKDQLIKEVQINKVLKNRISHSRALQIEEIRIKKSLLKEQGKVKALEEEFEKPINVHRWRFLEGTNPEMLQLIKMNIELRDRLTTKIAILARLHAKQKQLHDDTQKAQKHYVAGYHGDIREEMRYYEEVWKQKQVQLTELGNKISSQQGMVLDYKEQIQAIREMVTDERRGYFKEKKKSDRIRATTAMALSRDPIKEKEKQRLAQQNQNTSHFIGGGFSVKALASPKRVKDPNQTPQQRAQTALAPLNSYSPQIFTPKSGKAIAKKPPSGWNPQRGALNPYLPTVSNNNNN